MSNLNQYINRAFSILVLSAFIFIPSVSYAIDEEEVELPEPQGACSLDKCSPATPCPSKDEQCYSANGVFYCCVEPPFPGARAVGE